MSLSRALVVFFCLMIAAVPGGCGKSQPTAGNQVAAAPETPIISGTVIYNQETGQPVAPAGQPATVGSSPAPGPPAVGAAVPSASVGAPVSGPTVGSPTVGSTVSSPMTGPTVGTPTTTPAAGVPSTTEAVPTAVPGGVSAPAGDPAAAPDVNPGANLTSPQTNATAGAAKSNVVASGNVPALAGAINQWRAAGTNLVGAKRFNDKPVIAGYSWMTHLLPYLGHNDLYGKFDFTKEWHEEANLPLACEEIPAFLDPSNPNRRMTIVGVKNAIGPAFTHYVGMAGVEDTRNLVAAELPRSDPRAGMFGYDQVARPEEITDGASNTIMIVGAGKIVGPWVSGGGATVRGARAPYFDDITGFTSATDPGAGAVVAMADGSVKRISKDIDPAVFRALCTIHGGETIDLKANANVIRQ